MFCIAWKIRISKLLNCSGSDKELLTEDQALCFLGFNRLTKFSGLRPGKYLFSLLCGWARVVAGTAYASFSIPFVSVILSCSSIAHFWKALAVNRIFLSKHMYSTLIGCQLWADKLALEVPWALLQASCTSNKYCLDRLRTGNFVPLYRI